MADASSRAWATRINVIAASPLVTAEQRADLYRRGGMRIAERVLLRPGCWVFSDRLAIGEGTLVGWGCFFENRETVVIGSGCSLAAQVSIATSTHEFGTAEQRAGDYAGRAVAIGDGCWIGARAVILPGVTIGDGCVIGAGAVVTKDCSPDGVYTGIPARRQRDL